MFRGLSHRSSLSWMCGGDFNENLHGYEKWGGAMRDENQMTGFRDTLEICGLEDLGFQGPSYTWADIRASGVKVRCRLDRKVANPHWQQLFLWTKVVVRNGSLSDHCSLILHCLRRQPAQRGQRPFRFEHMWFRHADFMNVVNRIWRDGAASAGSVTSQIAMLQSELCRWNKEVFLSHSHLSEATHGSTTTLFQTSTIRVHFYSHA